MNESILEKYGKAFTQDKEMLDLLVKLYDEAFEELDEVYGAYERAHNTNPDREYSETESVFVGLMYDIAARNITYLTGRKSFNPGEACMPQMPVLNLATCAYGEDDLSYSVNGNKVLCEMEADIHALHPDVDCEEADMFCVDYYIWLQATKSHKPVAHINRIIFNQMDTLIEINGTRLALHTCDTDRTKLYAYVTDDKKTILVGYVENNSYGTIPSYMNGSFVLINRYSTYCSNELSKFSIDDIVKHNAVPLWATRLLDEHDHGCKRLIPAGTSSDKWDTTHDVGFWYLESQAADEYKCRFETIAQCCKFVHDMCIEFTYKDNGERKTITVEKDTVLDSLDELHARVEANPHWVLEPLVEPYNAVLVAAVEPEFQIDLEYINGDRDYGVVVKVFKDGEHYENLYSGAGCTEDELSTKKEIAEEMYNTVTLYGTTRLPDAQVFVDAVVSEKYPIRIL
ncbi:MAG: hypothetical protein RR382_00580 [Tannerellaceae bacterium]